MPLTLQDAEQVKEVLLDPMREAMRSEFQTQLAPLVAAQKANAETIEQNTKDIQDLKDTQRKALLGFGIYASIAAVAVGSAWSWFTSKLHWS